MHPAAKTSINQVPAIISQYVKEHAGGKHLSFDYGCGRYTKATELLKSVGITNLGYDKYFLDEETNRKHLNRAKNSKDLQVVFCANVLNVVLDKNERRKIIQNLHDVSLLSRAAVIISVYSKNGDSVAAGTQTNMPAEAYQEEIEEVFSGRTIKRKGNVFYITQEV